MKYRMKVFLLLLIGVISGGCVQQTALTYIPKGNNSDEKLLSVKPPVVTHSMASKGIEGWVMVEFSVNEEGRVFDAKMVDESPPGLFTKIAIDSVKTSVYKPKYVDDKAVPAYGKLRKVTIQKQKGLPVNKIDCTNSDKKNLTCQKH